VAADPSARGDHAVTRNDDRDRIPTERLADGAAPARLSDPSRDLAVGDDAPRRHAERGHEHAALERSHVAEVETDVALPPLAREVRAELVDDLGRLLRRAHDVHVESATELRGEGRLALRERDADEPCLGCGDEDPT